jgi:hypothetical protein
LSTAARREHPAIPSGEFEARAHYDDPTDRRKATSLEILRADPRITIAADVLDDIALGDIPFATLTGPIVRIEGSNRTVIYRIVKYLGPEVDAYIAEWPD